MKQFLIEDFNINEKKIEVIPNGFFEEFFEKDNYILNEKLITFVGLLTKWASVEKVIYAASKIKDEKVKFLIIGDGPEKSNLEKLANYYNLKNIIFTGSLPIKEVYHYLAISDILICPLQKRLALEVACPIKLLEYAGMAKPIIVDYVGEIPELFYENKAALVSYDLISFIKNVELLIYNDDLKKSLSNNAKKISNDYTWDKQVDKMILLYKNLIR